MIGSINDWKSKMGMSLLLHIRGNLGELGEGGLEVFDDFGGDHIGIGKVGAVFEAFVFEPEPSRWEVSEANGRAKSRLSGSEGVNMSRFRLESPAVAAASVTGRV